MKFPLATVLAALSLVAVPARVSAASGDGWLDDDTINARVQEGTPRTNVGAGC